MLVLKKERTSEIIDHNPIVRKKDIQALNKAENDLLESRNLCPNGSLVSGFLQNLSYLINYYRVMCAKGSNNSDFNTAKTMANQVLNKLGDYLEGDFITSVTLKERKYMDL